MNGSYNFRSSKIDKKEDAISNFYNPLKTN